MHGDMFNERLDATGPASPAHHALAGYLKAADSEVHPDLQSKDEAWDEFRGWYNGVTGQSVPKEPRPRGSSVSRSANKYGVQFRLLYRPGGVLPDLPDGITENPPSGRFHRLNGLAGVKTLIAHCGLRLWNDGQHEWAAGETVYWEEAGLLARQFGVKIDPVEYAAVARNARKDLDEMVRNKFRLYQSAVADASEATRNRVNVIARKQAFRRRIQEGYDWKCALTNEGLIAGDRRGECEAAHICPLAANGSDDPRNGLLLDRRAHYAFDNGMWTLDPNGLVVVSEAAIREHPEANYAWLTEMRGRRLRQPNNESITPDPAAWAWHRKHVFRE